MIFSCLGFTGWAQLLPPEQQPIPVDGFAAIVNERVITAGDVLTLIDRDRQMVMQSERDPKARATRLQALYEEGLQMLIDRALILEAFNEVEEDGKIKVPENLVDDRVYEIVNKRFSNDRTAFEQALIEEGTSLSEWRDQIRDNLKVQILRRQEVYDRLAIHPRQVRELYDQRAAELKVEAEVHLRSIALKRPEDRDARTEVLRKLYEIRLKVKAGEDFATLARAHSEGPKAADGGDFGWTKWSYLKPELQEAIAELELGDVSNVVKSDDFYYLLKLEGKKSGELRSLSEMQDELESELMAAEEKNLYEAWMARLRNKYHVNKF